MSAVAEANSESLLLVNNIEVIYDHVILVLKGVSLEVMEGGVVALLGANGAGKTTMLRSISGLITNDAAQISYRGQQIGNARPDVVAQMGLAMVPEGRQLFPSLSVEENLMIGGRVNRKGPWNLRRVYDLFPILEERRAQASTSLSGGQQQMVAIGRALMSNPDLIMFDEISLGLAPVIIRDIYKALPGIVGGGMSAVIVEQDITKALAVSSRVYCLQEGRVSLEGRSDTVSRDEIARAYFGVE